MDPNACVDVVLKDATYAITPEAKDDRDLDGTIVEMSQHFLDLDEWIRKGGFLPARWDRPVVERERALRLYGPDLLQELQAELAKADDFGATQVAVSVALLAKAKGFVDDVLRLTRLSTQPDNLVPADAEHPDMNELPAAPAVTVFDVAVDMTIDDVTSAAAAADHGWRSICDLQNPIVRVTPAGGGEAVVLELQDDGSWAPYDDGDGEPESADYTVGDFVAEFGPTVDGSR